MKNLTLALLVLFTFTAKANSFKLRPFTEKTLPNGLQVLLIEDKVLPYISFNLLVKSGSTTDPENKKGLSFFVANLLEKGSQKKNAVQISDTFGQIASDFSGTVDTDNIYFTSSGLSAHRKLILNLFAELVISPTFQQTEIDRLKSQVLSQLKQMPEKAGSFSDKAFQSYLYSTHPYSVTTIGKIKDVEAIQRQDIVRHYFKYVRPNNAILAVVGQFPPTFIKDIEAAFAKWNKHETKTLTYADFPPIEKIKIQVVHRADLNQAQVRIGQAGIPRNSPDFLPLNVANTIMGVGFSSRLMDQIRDNLGLTYGINSQFETRKDTGSFEISTFTRTDKVGEIVRKTLEIIEKFQNAGVTDKEIEAAKGYMIGVFPRSLETAEQLASRLMGLRLYGLPDSYLTNYAGDVNKITKDEVNRVIAKYIKPKNLKIFIYTNKATLGDQLKGFNDIEYKDYQDLM